MPERGGPLIPRRRSDVGLKCTGRSDARSCDRRGSKAAQQYPITGLAGPRAMAAAGQALGTRATSRRSRFADRVTRAAHRRRDRDRAGTVPSVFRCRFSASRFVVVVAVFNERKTSVVNYLPFPGPPSAKGVCVCVGVYNKHCRLSHGVTGGVPNRAEGFRAGATHSFKQRACKHTLSHTQQRS